MWCVISKMYDSTRITKYPHSSNLMKINMSGKTKSIFLFLCSHHINLSNDLDNKKTHWRRLIVVLYDITRISLHKKITQILSFIMFIEIEWWRIRVIGLTLQNCVVLLVLELICDAHFQSSSNVLTIFCREFC